MAKSLQFSWARRIMLLNLASLLAAVPFSQPTVITPVMYEPPENRTSDEQRLLWHVLRFYDANVRPVYKHSDKVEVAVGLTLTHIFNIDEKSQVLSLNVWLGQQWYDERINWNPRDFNNLKTITVPKRFLWTPDIVLFNNAEDFSQGMVQTNAAVFQDGRVYWLPPVKFRSTCQLNMQFLVFQTSHVTRSQTREARAEDFSQGMVQTNAAVFQDGRVYWLPPVKFRSTCQLNMQFFPFDRQKCSLKFRSWIYDGNQIVITNKSENIDLTNYNEHGEWDLIEIEQHLEMESYNSKSHFSVIVFTLHLQRRTLFYMYNILIPCVMLSLLTMMQFWLPCESGEKVTLGLTVVLAYSVFNFNIAESMPETSDVIPLVAVYIMCIMAISCMAVCFSVMVLKVRHGGERQQRVPQWLGFFADRILAPIFCFPRKELKKIQAGNEQNASVNRAFHALSTYIVGIASNEHDETNDPTFAQATSSRIGQSVEPGAIQPNDNQLRPQPTETLTRRHRRASMLSSLHETIRQRPRPTSKEMCVSALDEAVAASRLKNIINRTAVLMNRFEMENHNEDTVAEWQRVSRIFDQFFFWIVFSLTLTCTVAMFATGFAHQKTAKRLPVVKSVMETVEGF